MTRAQARAYGAAAITAVALLQGFNSAACYGHNLVTYLDTLLYIAIPMLPALVSLATKNPLRAVGASLLFAPWLVIAFYVDCVLPYQGGGASMIYVAVVLWGFPSALIGALVTGPTLRMLNLSLDEH